MSVQEAYAEVGRITRREAKNFAYGIMVLPRPKRQAVAAIYAFARRVDDLADGELPVAEKRGRGGGGGGGPPPGPRGGGGRGGAAGGGPRPPPPPPAPPAGGGGGGG